MKTELIVALDVDTMAEAEKIVSALSPGVKYFKIGSQLFTASGPEIVKRIAGLGGRIFLDLKFHDIPNTVKAAVSSAAAICSECIGQNSFPPVFMMTVHACAGLEVLKAAMKGAQERSKSLNVSRPLVVGVTVLTSENLGADTGRIVLERARTAKDAGLDGVVCSVHETAALRKEFGENFVIVNPGIRPAGADKADQKRTATPEEAMNAGASFIVVGRPILEAPDPGLAAAKISEVLNG